jgi:DNA-binding Lrp family transcriptional regulator
MGNDALAWAWRQNLPATQKFVLVALADHTQEQETGFECHPGQERIARMIGASRQTVNRAMAVLESDGYITRKERRRPDGYRTSDQFFLDVKDSRIKLVHEKSADLMSDPDRSHVTLTPDLMSVSETVTVSKNHQIEPTVLKDSLDLVVEPIPIAAWPIKDLFDQAWAHWPKRVERKQAHDRFIIAARRRRPDILAADIIRFGDAYAATTETKFVPALGVWLNGDRWDDDLPTIPAPASAPRMSRAQENWNAGAVFRNPQMELRN